MTLVLLSALCLGVGCEEERRGGQGGAGGDSGVDAWDTVAGSPPDETGTAKGIEYGQLSAGCDADYLAHFSGIPSGAVLNGWACQAASWEGQAAELCVAAPVQRVADVVMVYCDGAGSARLTWIAPS